MYLFALLQSRHFFARHLMVIFFAGGLITSGIWFMPQAFAESELSQEMLVALVKPSVVRIVSHAHGTARIPRIKVNIQQRLVAVIPDTYTDIPIDEYLVGSGFIVHSDGYIATNAHVISPMTLKRALATESALPALYNDALLLSDEEMEIFLNKDNKDKFSDTVLQYVLDNSIFDITTQTVVLRPDSSQQEIKDLFAEGFPATTISVNENFFVTEKDVALLKIEETHLPALSFGTDNALAVGKKAYIFGFPANAEFNQNNSAEATFTQGVVSAIKRSMSGDFNIFQTDAKVSEGSSGGPLFGEQGAVTGMITFQTDGMIRTQGDNFAFALPVALIQQMAQESDIPLAEGSYGTLFRQGMIDFSQKYCEKARSALEEAVQSTNPIFVTASFVNPYLEQCNIWRTQGITLDTSFSVWKEQFLHSENSFFFVIGIGLIVLGLLIGLLFWMVRQVRREEKEIKILEARLQRDEASMMKYAEHSLTEKKKEL
ncbi:MAG: S1C family serine protease [Minisyncoccota bacterium]